MEKRIYISADYDPNSGDCAVVDELVRWANDQRYKIEFKDMAAAKSGSVSDDKDCRACDLKREFNQKINISSIVIFVVGDKTKTRTAGSTCNRANTSYWQPCKCTPYKGNTNGSSYCTKDKFYDYMELDTDEKDGHNVNYVNNFSFLQHEFEQAKYKRKKIIILYNSSRKEREWLPHYMKGYEYCAIPFWIREKDGSYVGNYPYIKKVLLNEYQNAFKYIPKQQSTDYYHFCYIHTAITILSTIYKSSDFDSFDFQSLEYGVDLNLFGVTLGR